MTDPVPRPVPVPDDTSAPFWTAAAEGVLVLARCSVCDTATHPPEVVCPHCRSTEPAWRWAPAASTGVVRSWTVLRQPFLPGFADDLPIVLVDVAIDATDDVRLVGRLLDPPVTALEPPAPAASQALRLGAAVALDFEHLADGVAVPAFRLAAP